MISLTIRIAAAGILLAATVATSSAQNQPGNQNRQAAPISPGGVRITARNPLQGNWVCKGTSCTCKPLACAASSTVRYSTAPTPARKPDPQALEKFAKVDVPKRVMAANAAQGVLSDGKVKVEMLSSKVTKHLGYPSVLAETKVSNEKSTIFLTYALVFVGPVLMTIQSASPDRAVAMKSLDDFVRVMSVEEGPPVSPNAPPPPAPSPGRPPVPQTRA